MAEIIVRDDETPQEVARRLLDQAEHPDHVIWRPRSNTPPHGGVFEVPDDEVEALVGRVEAARAADEAATKRRLDAAAERDELADRTGLTPEQLGFPANAADDRASLGQPDTAEDGDLDEDDADDGASVDAEIAAEDEAAASRAAEPEATADEGDEDSEATSRAQARAKARRASRKGTAAAADADASKTDKE